MHINRSRNDNLPQPVGDVEAGRGQVECNMS